MRGTVVLVIATLVLAGCAEGEEGEERESARVLNESCDGRLDPKPLASPFPADVPGIEGQTVLESAQQGATRLWFAYVRGTSVVVARDAAKAQLERAGYRILSTDEEGNAEAEVQFGGRHEGSVQVVPLCRGTLRVRYRLSD